MHQLAAFQPWWQARHETMGDQVGRDDRIQRIQVVGIMGFLIAANEFLVCFNRHGLGSFFVT